MNNAVDIIRSIWSLKLVRIFSLLIVLSLIGWLIIYLVNRVPDLSINNTHIGSGSQVSVLGDKLAIYNGTSFYTINPLSESTPSVIYTPSYRLPVVSAVVWSDTKGALLKFKSGIMYTPIQDYFLNNNSYLQGKGYGSWYLNFSDGSINLVDSDEFDQKMTFYSNSKNGYYYMTSDGVVKFYDLKSHNSRIVTTGDSGVVITAINACDTGDEKLCVIGHKTNTEYGKSSLFSITNLGGLQTVNDYDGLLNITPTKNVYILLTDGKEYNEVDTIYNTVKVIDASNNSVQTYTGNVFSGDISVGMQGDKYYVLDGMNNEYLLLDNRSHSAAVKTLQLPQLNNGSESVVLSGNQNSSQLTLVYSTSKNTYALSGVNQPQKYSLKAATQVTANVQDCAKKSNATAEFTDSSVRVFIPDNESFSASIKTVMACIAKDAGNLLGYNYEYRGISPINGRISTD